MLDLYEKVPCATCSKPVERIDLFPYGNCLDCHDRKHRNDAPEFPDFTKAINA